MTIERTLTQLIFGPSGAGKSRLASTAPPPRLIIDLEGRGKYTPNGRGAVVWDGMSDPMKLERSPTRTYLVPVTDATVVMQSIFPWLKSGKHPFVSVDVDSLMEAQIRHKRVIAPGRSLKDYEWGDLLIKMEDLVRDFRDLTNDPRTGVKVVVFVAGVGDATKANGYLRPLMQGQINSKLPYFVDVSSYMEAIYDVETGQTIRQLWIGQRPQNDLEVKDGTDDIVTRFGPRVEIAVGTEQRCDLTKMYEALLPESGEEKA